MSIWLELSQCSSCSNLQEFQKAFICQKCFNPSQFNKGKKRPKLPYYHQLKTKFENLTDKMNEVIDLGASKNLIGRPNKRYFLSNSNNLGELKILETYQFPLLLLNINLLKVGNPMEVVLKQNNLIHELLTLFECFVLPKCTPFLPSKLKKLDRSKKGDSLLLFAILTRSEFLCKCHRLCFDGKKYSFILENIYFYSCYKSLLPLVNEPSLELVQALLLIADLETTYGFSLLQLNSVKAITYSQILYLHELDNPIHENDNEELRAEKILTWQNCIIMEQKCYFHYSSQRLQRNSFDNFDYFDYINQSTTLPIYIKKWVIHVQLVTNISVNIANAMRIKRVQEKELMYNLDLNEKLVEFIRFVKSESLSKLPEFYFREDKLEFNSYHSAMLFQYVFYHMAKICILDLFDTLLNSQKYQSKISLRLTKIMKKEMQTNIISAQKIMEIATETISLSPLTEEHLSHLEVSHTVFFWSYFFALRTLLKTNEIKFNELGLISIVMEKLKKFMNLWPIQKNLYDILTLDLENRGIIISYHDLNLN